LAYATKTGSLEPTQEDRKTVSGTVWLQYSNTDRQRKVFQMYF